MKPEKIRHEVEQGTEEWHALRIGKITSSNFGDICANMGRAFGDPAKRYARKVALERITGKLDEQDNYSNSHMERGIEQEPLARSMYEEITFNSVDPGGFTELGPFGDSPDGVIGSTGCLEIKCVAANTHWERLERGGFDNSYKWQILGHLWVNGLEWCDFAQYCESFPDNMRLYLYRVRREEFVKDIEQMELRLYTFESLVRKYVQFYHDKQWN